MLPSYMPVGVREWVMLVHQDSADNIKTMAQRAQAWNFFLVSNLDHFWSLRHASEQEGASVDFCRHTVRHDRAMQRDRYIARCRCISDSPSLYTEMSPVLSFSSSVHKVQRRDHKVSGQQSKPKKPNKNLTVHYENLPYRLWIIRDSTGALFC